MIGCLWTGVRKQPIIALYFELETVLRFYNLEDCQVFTVDVLLTLVIDTGNSDTSLLVFLKGHVDRSVISNLKV